VIETNFVSKRVNLTLPDAVYEDLERWASLQGRPSANLAAFLVEVAIRKSKESGELPPAPEKAEITREAS
jgi:hypothetical protein